MEPDRSAVKPAAARRSHKGLDPRALQLYLLDLPLPPDQLGEAVIEEFAMAAHYTWSAFIDGPSETFNPSTSGEVAVSQDSSNRRADRGRASYDRPQRLVVNGVYELSFRKQQRGIGRLVGSWQVSAFLTFQSGAPFTALNGADRFSLERHRLASWQRDPRQCKYQSGFGTDVG
jgi:hypothetical protein